MTNTPENLNYLQGELFTYRDIIESLPPDDIYFLIKDARAKLYDTVEEMNEVKGIIALATEILNQYGEDFEDMAKRDLS